jgi:hypothetical protein
MKILLVTSEFFAWGVYGGYGSFARKLGGELVKHGVEVDVIVQKMQRGEIGQTQHYKEIHPYSLATIRDDKVGLKVFMKWLGRKDIASEINTKKIKIVLDISIFSSFVLSFIGGINVPFSKNFFLLISCLFRVFSQKTRILRAVFRL